MRYYFEGMHGIGDNINQRCFIKTLLRQNHEIWLQTPLPEIYYDLNKPGEPKRLHFVKTNTTLRTQAFYEEKSQMIWEQVPHNAIKRRIFYGNHDLMFGNVYTTMSQPNRFDCDPMPLSLPDYTLFKSSNFTIDNIIKPLAVIRPTSERKEWHNASRGPLNTYVNEAARMLSKAGYYVISVGWNQGTMEWMPAPTPFCHKAYNCGELSLFDLFYLISKASVILTGPCVIFHAALAYKKPMICIFGGNGGNNHHIKIMDPRVTDMNSVQSVGGDCELSDNKREEPGRIRKKCNNYFIYPDNFCYCQIMEHSCDKQITNFNKKLMPFIAHLKQNLDEEKVKEKHVDITPPRQRKKNAHIKK